MRVLVADDEYYARKAILKILAELDVEVAADMETGQEVIDYLERDPQIDAVITDIRMPEVNGLQVAEYVSRVHPEVAVLIVTGYADFNYAQQALRYGVKDYITKPIRRETIKKALDNVSLAQLRKETAHQAYGRETDLEFTMEQLSVKELAQNPDLQRTFMKRSLQYMEYNKTVELATLRGLENKDEFTIGFDYLLINNESTASVPVTIEITNESKKVVARYQNLKIPYERNKETNIRGHFMTASPGIDFDPDFEDEDIIIDVTPITPTE